MRNFLDDFIKTMSPEGAKKAAYVLSDAKVGKEQFQRVVDRLNKNMVLGKVELSSMKPSDRISGGLLAEIFNELDINLTEIFRRSNDISLLLDNYLGVLTSDIKSLEDELAVLEKAVDNYAFLLADNGSYDYAFLEGFNDARNRELELEILPDRADTDFRPHEWASVDSVSGNLIMTNNNITKALISDIKLVSSNIAPLMTTREFSSLKNMTDPRLDSGWRVSAQVPSPLSGTLEGFHETGSEDTSVNGAQFIIEFTLVNPSPLNVIRVDPFSDWSFTLSEVRVYPDNKEDSNFQKVWAEPTEVNHPFLINFPLSVVSRFRFYIRQPEYRRDFATPVAAEIRNQQIFDELTQKNIAPDIRSDQTQILPLSGTRSSYGWWDQRMFMALEDQNKLGKDSPFSVSIPRTDYRKNWGSFSFRSNRLERKTFEEHRKAWSDEDWVTRLIGDVVKDIANSEAIWGSKLNTPKQVKPSWDSTSNNIRTNRDPNMPFSQPSDNANMVQTMGEGRTKHPYTYTLGIREVTAGIAQRMDRAVFVSRRLDAPGDIGAVRIKSDYTDIKVTDTDRDLDRVTSIEFSVSNISKPTRDVDWIPILPIGTEEIIGERLYPDIKGRCLLRFTAKREAPIRIYINGYHKSNYNILDVARPVNSTSYNAVEIPVSDFNSTDIITVDYTPSHDFTVIEFPPLDPTKSPPLVSSYDTDGAGEGFTDSGNQLVIGLQHNPFIDYVQVDDAVYVEDSGLSGYSPITVQFADGTNAINLTNYKGGEQSLLNSGSSSYQFIHSGKTLMFNKLITQSFRVFYQFQPSDVRVRVVLRCNFNQFTSPRVDFYQLKGKTKKADARRAL